MLCFRKPKGRSTKSINDEVLRSVLENDPKTSDREYKTNFNVSNRTISNYLRVTGKKKKGFINGFYLNEEQPNLGMQ